MHYAQQMANMATQITRLKPLRPVGRVKGVQAGVLRISGLSDHARLGDEIVIKRTDKTTLHGEIIQLNQSDIFALPDSPPDGVGVDDRAVLHEPTQVSPDDTWIGRVIDANGNPLDGRALIQGLESRPLIAAPPAAAQRKALGPRLDTGLAVLNTMLPLVAGQRVGLFAGSGVGKSSLLGTLAQHLEADIIVISMVGERGREVRHFLDSVLGPEGQKRSIIIAATSDQSPLYRRKCAWTAMAVAEHFRDQGKSVLLLVDSITRFAEAHREIAVAAGEAPVLRGFPPSTSHQIMALCERAGPGAAGQGDITAVFSVLVAGSDMDEPVADIMRGVLDGHIVLERAIAERGRYPAIDVVRSVSRSLPEAVTPEQNALIAKARRLLGTYEENSLMVKAGLYVQGSDPVVDH